MGNNYDDSEWSKEDLGEENSESTTGLMSDNDEEPEIEPVAFSKAKTCVIALIFIFMIVIILLTVRGCSIQRKSEIPAESGNTESTTVEEITEDTSNNVENDINNSQNSTESTEVEPLSEEEIVTTEIPEVNKDEVPDNVKENSEEEIKDKKDIIDSNTSLTEVQDPSLSEVLNSTGIVSGKKIYKIGNGYLYEIRLIMVMGNDENTFASYYCPRKTFDALESGSSVNIEYQLDSTGCISITSISN